MRVWVAVWTGSALISRMIGQWLAGGVALRLTVIVGGAAFVKGLPWTTRIVVILAVWWLTGAIALGLRADRTQPQPEPDAVPEPEGEQQPAPAAEARPEPTRDEVAALLHSLLGETGGVHLKTLAEHLPAGPWKTAQVRALLGRHGIRVRAGVRAPGADGREGVHRADVPPHPSPSAGAAPVAVVVPGQSNNNNADDAPTVERREGMSIIRDPADRVRRTLLRRP
ncbi:hypothetical protein ACWF94_24795 [Streptomyces sp. NPDC055078]